MCNLLAIELIQISRAVMTSFKNLRSVPSLLASWFRWGKTRKKWRPVYDWRYDMGSWTARRHYFHIDIIKLSESLAWLTNSLYMCSILLLCLTLFRKRQVVWTDVSLCIPATSRTPLETCWTSPFYFIYMATHIPSENLFLIWGDNFFEHFLQK